MFGNVIKLGFLRLISCVQFFSRPTGLLREKNVIFLISISDLVLDQAIKMSVLNIERAYRD